MNNKLIDKAKFIDKKMEIIKKDRLFVNNLEYFAEKRLELMGNNINDNRVIVKIWLDDLEINKDLKILRAIKTNDYEVVFLVIEYNFRNKKLSNLVRDKLDVKLSDREKIFEIFGWESMRKASIIMKRVQKVYFQRMGKEIDFTKAIDKCEKTKNGSLHPEEIVIKKRLDEAKKNNGNYSEIKSKELNLQEYVELLIIDLKNMEEIIRKPLSRVSYSKKINEKEKDRYVKFSLLVLSIFSTGINYKELEYYEFLCKYFEVEISDKDTLKTIVYKIQSSLTHNIIENNNYDKNIILIEVFKNFVQYLHNINKDDWLGDIWLSPKKIVEYLDIKEKEIKQADLVLLKYSAYRRTNTEITSYRRLLEYEKRSEWIRKKKDYRIAQGKKIFEQINHKNLKLRKLEKKLEEAVDKNERQEIREKIKKVKKETKNNTLVNISKGIVFNNSKLKIHSRPILYKELDTYLFSEYKKILNKIKKENEKESLGKTSEEIFENALKKASHELFLKEDRLKKIVKRNSE